MEVHNMKWIYFGYFKIDIWIFYYYQNGNRYSCFFIMRYCYDYSGDEG